MRVIARVVAALLVALPGVRDAGATTSLAGGGGASGTAGGAALCESAALRAAAEAGVPPDIMGALTLSETGRRSGGAVRPWAWSVNAEGAGSWFDAPGQALAYASQRIAQGRPNVDIGCFQLNFRWHGQHFPSLDAMFDPLTNARYAARFVRELYAESGDWRTAAGMFHSRSPAEAARYLSRFDDLRQALRRTGFDNLQDAPETYNRFADAQTAAVAPPGPAGSEPVGTPVLPPELAAALGLSDAADPLNGPPAGPTPAHQPRAARPRVTLLGAPLGSAGTGRAGSLAVLGGGGGPIIRTGGASLIGDDRAGRSAPEGQPAAAAAPGLADPLSAGPLAAAQAPAAAEDAALIEAMAAIDPDRDWPGGAGLPDNPPAALRNGPQSQPAAGGGVDRLAPRAAAGSRQAQVMPGETAPYEAVRKRGGPQPAPDDAAFVTDPSGRFLILADRNAPDPFTALPPELRHAPRDGGL